MVWLVSALAFWVSIPTDGHSNRGRQAQTIKTFETWPLLLAAGARLVLAHVETQGAAVAHDSANRTALSAIGSSRVQWTSVRDKRIERGSKPSAKAS